MIEPGTTLLIVDDDAPFRDRLGRAMAARGLEVRCAPDAGSALRMAAAESPELAVVDLRMPGGSGLAVLRGLRDLDPGTRVVVLTGWGSIATAVEAIRLGAVHYLSKPADADEILAAFEPGADAIAESAPVTPSLARVEWEHLQRVLQDCDGNLSEASRRLGLHRRSLQRKLSRVPPGA